MDKNFYLFDLDGTLTDPMIGITKSVKYALDSFGIETESLKTLCKFIGPPLAESFSKYYSFTKEEAAKAVNKYREYFSVTGIYENVVYDGIDDILNNLYNRGKSIILATSKPTEFAERILSHFNLSKYFNDVCGSNLDGSRTDKAEVIQYALKRNSISDLSSAIMIGDREHDILGAFICKIESVGVLYGYGNLEELKSAKADYIVSSVQNLKKLLIN